MEQTETAPPESRTPALLLRKAGVALAWLAYGLWVAVRWLFEGRRGLIWLACLALGGWFGWGHRYQIAEEWGRLRGRYQGAMDREREEARRGGKSLKDQQKELDSVK